MNDDKRDVDSGVVPVDAHARGFARLFWPVFVGACMGSADLVPGVSGGTIALVLGVYERLLANIRQGARLVASVTSRSVTSIRSEAVAIEWLWLVRLFAGILGVVFVLAGPLHGGLDRYPIEFSALFCGLIAGSIVTTSMQLRSEHPVGSKELVVGLVAAVATALVLGLQQTSTGSPGLGVLFLGGAVASCAMILPGVSGSFLLLAIGLYEPVLQAVSDRNVTEIAAIGAGAVVGLTLFSTILSWLLARWPAVVTAALIGLMAGSLRVLWPWPQGDGVGDPAVGPPVAGDVASTVIFSLVGLVVVLVLDRARRALATSDAAQVQVVAREVADGVPAGESGESV